MSNMKAVRSRVKADIECGFTAVYKLSDFFFVRNLGNQAAGFQFGPVTLRKLPFCLLLFCNFLRMFVSSACVGLYMKTCYPDEAFFLLLPDSFSLSPVRQLRH